MGRNRHDCAGTVAHQYIVGNPDGDFFSVDRIDCGQTIDLYTGLFFCQLGTLEVRLSCSLLLICFYFIQVFDLGCKLFNIRVLRGNYHISYTEQSIRTCRINTQLVFLACDREIHLGTGRTADPVFLGNLDALDVIDVIQTFQQLIRILSDL